MIALLLLASIIVFSVLFVIPGDPAEIILGMNATPESLETLRTQLGLNDPFLARYFNWISGYVTGKSSLSINYGVPVFDLLVKSLSVTLPLALLAVAVSVVIAVPSGILAARYKNTRKDILIMAGTQLGLATPEFWLGILLILLLSVELGWFHAGGFPGWSSDPVGSLKALIMPALALGVVRASVLTRVTRASMLEVLEEDYMRTARAKGLMENTVIYVHAFKNAVIPILTILGLQLGQLLAGAIIIENVFYLPGVGRLLFQAIGQRDLPVVREAVLVMAGFVIIVHFIVDLVHAAIDPRIRLEKYGL